MRFKNLEADVPSNLQVLTPPDSEVASARDLIPALRGWRRGVENDEALFVEHHLDGVSKIWFLDPVTGSAVCQFTTRIGQIFHGVDTRGEQVVLTPRD